MTFNTSLTFIFAIVVLFYTTNNLVGYNTCQVINLISKNVTNFLLNQLKNDVHPYNYDLSNCYGTWYSFRSQRFCRRSRLCQTWPLFHIYVFGQIGFTETCWIFYGFKLGVAFNIITECSLSIG